MVCEHEKFVSYLISKFVKNKHYGFIILKKIKDILRATCSFCNR